MDEVPSRSHPPENAIARANHLYPSLPVFLVCSTGKLLSGWLRWEQTNVQTVRSPLGWESSTLPLEKCLLEKETNRNHQPIKRPVTPSTWAATTQNSRQRATSQQWESFGNNNLSCFIALKSALTYRVALFFYREKHQVAWRPA